MDAFSARQCCASDGNRCWQAAGGKPLVAMCGSGVTACHNLLALELIGRTGQLYAGSFSEWITNPARPVATGAMHSG